jgi:Sulfotransferase family
MTKTRRQRMTTRALHERPVVFQHIPKTAGVSLRSIISSNFHTRDILHVPDRYWKDRRFAIRAARRYPFIHGHLHYEFLRDIIGSTRVITFLRDPVERVLSLYFFLRAQPRGTQADRIARLAVEEAHRLTIEEFVAHTHPQIASMVSDYQVQMILSDGQIDRPGRTWVATALANLESYEFVGIADADLMSRSVIAMSRIFGWTPSGDAPRVNHTVRSVRARQLAAARRIIADRNQRDLSLYERVRADLRRSLATNNGRARARSAVQAERARYRTGLTSPVTMDQPLRCWGWHDREFRVGKLPWRCAAQWRVGLDLRLPGDSRVALFLNLNSAHPRVSLGDTALEARGRILPSRIFLSGKRWVIATLIHRRDIRDGIVSLVIRCKKAESAESAATKTNPDSRFVTLALESIEVISEAGAGSHTVSLLERALGEPAQSRALARELHLERSSRKAEHARAELHAAALTERAERAEAYCASLAEELTKQQEENRALTAGRERDLAIAERCSADVIARAARAESYCASLTEELKKQHENNERENAALLDRAQRSEKYSTSLAEEVTKQQQENRALIAAREKELATAERYSADLIERATRAEAYCVSLAEELKKQQADNRRQQIETQTIAAARAAEQRAAEEYQHSLVDRATRSETYCHSLQSELARLKEENRALSSALERERVAAEPQLGALAENS